MTAKDAIRQGLVHSGTVLEKYLEGLTDDDLRLVPVEGMNPIAWQVGHLIHTDSSILGMVKPGSAPTLPEGFNEAHPRDPSTSNGKFLSRDEYLRLFKEMRAAMMTVLETLDDAALDTPSPEAVRKRMPTLGNMLNLSGTHTMMHAGQFVAVRRGLKLPTAV